MQFMGALTLAGVSVADVRIFDTGRNYMLKKKGQNCKDFKITGSKHFEIT